MSNTFYPVGVRVVNGDVWGYAFACCSCHCVCVRIDCVSLLNWDKIFVHTDGRADVCCKCSNCKREYYCLLCEYIMRRA